MEDGSGPSGGDDVLKERLQRKVRNNDQSVKLRLLVGKSKLLENFMRVEHNGSNTVYAACKRCAALVKFTPAGGTSGLSRHTCKSNASENQPKVTSYVKRKLPPGVKSCLTNKLARMSSMDLRPFATVEGQGFIMVAQELLDIGSRYGGSIEAEDVLPCARTVSRHVDGEFQKVKTLVMEELKQVRYCIM